MPIITCHDRDGLPLSGPLFGEEAQALLWQLGVQCGQWALKPQPISMTPMLTYARELLALQQQQHSVLTDRVRQRGGAQAGDPRDHHSVAWPEQRVQHTHDDAEVRVLLAGAARLVLRAPALGGWLTAQFQPGAWWVLPAGLPHSFEASPTRGVELLRLFSRPGAWVMQRAPVQAPVPLSRWHEGSAATAPAPKPAPKSSAAPWAAAAVNHDRGPGTAWQTAACALPAGFLSPG